MGEGGVKVRVSCGGTGEKAGVAEGTSVVCVGGWVIGWVVFGACMRCV